MRQSRFIGMSVPVRTFTSASEARSRRAMEAYRMAERLGRPAHSSEWRRLCRADYTRRSMEAYGDLIPSTEKTEDATLTPVDIETDQSHFGRMACMLSILGAGALSLLGLSIYLY